MRKNESTLKLEENFLDELEKFDSFEAMGEAWGISAHHIRSVILTNVARKIGVDRDELLFYPGRGNRLGNGGRITILKPVDFNEFWPKYFETLEELKNVVEELKKFSEDESV